MFGSPPGRHLLTRMGPETPFVTHTRAAAAAAVAAVLLSGCGGAQSDAARLGADNPAGARIFKSDCSACHTLTGHDTRSAGGDLGLLPGTVAEVESFARIMPVHPRLTPADVANIATYLVDIERELARQRQ